MGVCGWFKRIKGKRRKKKSMPLKLEDSIDRTVKLKESNFLVSKKEYAATQIQAAFRAYKARKRLRYLKVISRFQALMKVDDLTMQPSTALGRLHFWSKMQAEISGRRLCKLAERRMKLTRVGDRVKVESKLLELEMKWWSGPRMKEENGPKMQHIQKATSKHQRGLAYAFSHQWRPNSTRCFGQAYNDLSKESWGWNWIEPWIVVYRLEGRVVVRPVVSPRARIREKPLVARRVSVFTNRSKHV